MILLVAVIALALGYLGFSITAGTPNPVRLSYAAWLSFHAAQAKEQHVDFLADEYGPLVFRTRQSILSLRTVVLTGALSNTWGMVCSAWPAPMYQVGTAKVGGNCTLVYPWLQFLQFSPNVQQSGILEAYVRAIISGKPGDGLILP